MRKEKKSEEMKCEEYKRKNVILPSSDSCRNIHIYAGYIPTQ